ncbi:Hypothetical protein GL50581_4421 [Giardia duodenalis ATCC 50581]|uniref:Uncharacterized protein n=1 Tax=Giardia intestinalis (strain ATCC 50581 / GS clone H7) TaxID=598745 RepID=C6M034_GIAIB|nr:Hypothetical protein GL50581_4421 [Giardia intestinalis ATCC 50581]
MPLTKESAAVEKRKLDEASSLISRLQNRLVEGVGSRTEAEAIRQKIVSLGGVVSQDVMNNAVKALTVSRNSQKRVGSLMTQTSEQPGGVGCDSGYTPSKTVPETWEALARDRLQIIHSEEEALKAAQTQKEKELREAQRRDMIAKRREKELDEKLEKMEPSFALGNTAWDNFGRRDQTLAKERNNQAAKAELARELKSAATKEQEQRRQQRRDYKQQGLYDPDALPHDRIDPVTGKPLHTALPDKYLEKMRQDQNKEHDWASEVPSRTETLQRAMLGLSQPVDTQTSGISNVTSSSTMPTRAGLKHATKVQAYQERAKAEKEELKNMSKVHKTQEAQNQELFSKANSAANLAKHDAMVVEVHAKKIQDEMELRQRREGGMELPTADEVAHSKKGAFTSTKAIDYSPEDERIPYNAKGASYIDQFGIEDEARLRRDRKHVTPLTEEEKRKMEKEFYYKRNPHKRPLSPTVAAIIENEKAASAKKTTRTPKTAPKSEAPTHIQGKEDFERLSAEEMKINALPCYIKPLI